MATSTDRNYFDRNVVLPKTAGTDPNVLQLGEHMAYPTTLQEKLIASMNEQAVYWLDPQQVPSAAKRAVMLRYLDHGGDLNQFITDLFNREQFDDASTYAAVNARLTALLPVFENILVLKGVVPA